MQNKSPFKENLEAKKYFWCKCGQSGNQPFCDASHKGTEYKPVLFEVLESKAYFLCGCKQTNNPPYCDGTHKNL